MLRKVKVLKGFSIHSYRKTKDKERGKEDKHLRAKGEKEKWRKRGSDLAGVVLT